MVTGVDAQANDPVEHDAGTVWVESVLDPGEPFRIKLHVDQRSWTLGREGAVRYALAVLQAAHCADFDAATLRLLVETGVDAAAAGRLIADDIRPDREPLDVEALSPLGLQSGVTTGGEPYTIILLDGQPVGQWDVRDAVGHAVTVLGAMVGASLGATLYQAMVAQVGLDPGRSRQLVRKLDDFRRL